MTYLIKRSDGSFLLNLVDGKIDTTSLSIPLIGKNVSDYGEYYNNTLVSLVENFASTQQPNSPLVGQLWYDKTSKTLKIYSSNGVFESVMPNIGSPSEPKLSSIGDLWIDTTTQQLKFKSTSTGFSVAGPIYTKEQGISGFQMITVTDTNDDPRDLLALYSKNKLVAVISTEAFTIRDDFVGSTNSITSVKAGGISVVTPGITMNNIPDIAELRLVGRAAVSDLADVAVIGNVDVNTIPPIYLTNYAGGQDITTGTLYIKNNEGLKIGVNAELSLEISGSASKIKQNASNQQLQIVGRNIVSGNFPAIVVDSINSRVGVLTESPLSDLDVNGSTVIRGDLSILGESNYLTASNLRINDKTVELNYSTDLVTDLLADGGGIVLHGTTDHTITWQESNGGNWRISENIDLTNQASTYKIAGQTVITANSLGESITTASGLTTVGTLNALTISNIIISGNSIVSTNFDRDIIISPSGSGRINASNSKIINVSTCTDALDAANKQYVDSVILQNKLVMSFSVDETNWGGNPQDYIIDLLNKMFPVTNIAPYQTYDIPDGARARILCSYNNYSTAAITTVTSVRSTVLVDKAGIQNSQDVLQDINFSVPSGPVSVINTYTVREFIVVNREWTYIGVV